jgi:thioredoxin 1
MRREIGAPMGFWVKRFAVAAVIVALAWGSGFELAKAADFSSVPVAGMVTMIDLGADKCIPCKLMAPIVAKIEKAYAGKAAIVFIDVWKYNDQVARFGIRAIPTQIFFDESGREVYRHIGFMSEKDIVQQLKKMGVEPTIN